MESYSREFVGLVKEMIKINPDERPGLVKVKIMV